MKKSFLTYSLLLAVLVVDSATVPASAADSKPPEELRKILDAPAPDPKEHSKTALAKIYLERSRAAGALESVDRELNELDVGIQVVGPNDPAAYELYYRGGSILLDKGDYPRGKAMREAALALAATSGRRFTVLNNLVGVTTRMRDRDAAASYLAQAEAMFSSERRGNRQWPRIRDLWEAMINESRGSFNYSSGYLTQAQPYYRACATAIRAYLGRNSNASDSSYRYLAHCTSRLVELAAMLGHVREAGAYVDDTREAAKTYAEKQNRSLYLARMTRPVARVYIEQGLLNEAKNLLESTITQSQKSQTGEASLHVADARLLLARMAMVQGNWHKADEIFRIRSVGMRAYVEESDELGTAHPDWGYTLLRLGRLKEAVEVLDANLKVSTQRYDEKSIYLWEARAFHALAVGAGGDRASAVKTLSVAVAKILELGRAKGATETGYLATARLNWFLEGYITFLADIHRSGTRVDGIEPGAEAFRMADLARGSRVQKALSAAIIRASINDPELAGVLRKAQDLEYQIKAASESLAIMQESKPDPKGKPNPNREMLIEKTRAELERLREDNDKAQAELKRKMPDYSELLDAKPLTVNEAQKLLRPQEALISLYSTQKQTLVWAVSAQGQTSFHVADLGQHAAFEIVTKLRKALDPSEADIGKVPSFDFNTAYELYQRLLAPVAPGWKSAKELTIVSHGALSELPFSVLISGAYKPNQSGIPFADHAGAPWLIKQAAISYLPSLAALANLRRAATQSAHRTFIGFGDPVFKSSQKSIVSPTALASRGFLRRNATLPGAAARGSESQPPQSNLELLEALPDTSEEVIEIAKILKADDARDIYLGRRASEQNVKASDLTQYRVVMFATHGLMPGELPALQQPALALSNPAVTGEKEDGLLTLSEILGLKLRADWVVLSACNTASPDGQAAEAVSGLGRAFFFAGAKALLVSHWPVETVSAKLLTTELFKRQAADSKLSRAQAVRDASLAVMQQSAKPDRGPAFSYAHPMFWAPFVVVGDGG